MIRGRMIGAAVVLLVVSTAADVAAQVRGGAPPGRGGGGRGRGQVRQIQLASPNAKDGAELPPKYRQDGAEVSPGIQWTGGPDSAASYVLIMHDIDAPVGQSGTDDVLHWLVWNIPGTARSLPEAVPAAPVLPDGTRQISVSGPYYRGPTKSPSGIPHHYVIELYALDTKLEVQAVGASPAETRAAVLAAMAGRVRGKGTMVVR